VCWSCIVFIHQSSVHDPGAIMIHGEPSPKTPNKFRAASTRSPPPFWAKNLRRRPPPLDLMAASRH